jgi:hypothetical protein
MIPSEKTRVPLSGKMKFILASLVGFFALVGAVGAFSLNSTEVVIGEVTKLMVPVLAVILAAVPIIVTMAIIAFIMGLLAAILDKLKL